MSWIGTCDISPMRRLPLQPRRGLLVCSWLILSFCYTATAFLITSAVPGEPDDHILIMAVERDSVFASARPLRATKVVRHAAHQDSRANVVRTLAAGRGFGKPREGSSGEKPPGKSTTGNGGQKDSKATSSQQRNLSPLGYDEIPEPFQRKFQMLYTCNICETRNLIKIDRIAYEKGVVVARCKGCDAKHLVADNLSKLDFGDGKLRLEDIAALKGETVKKLNLADRPDLARYQLRQLEDGTVELLPKDGEEGQSAGKAAPGEQ